MYTLTLTVDAGALSFDSGIAGNMGITSVTLDPSNLFVTILGTVDAINTAIGQGLVKYTPVADSNNLVDTDGVQVTAVVDDGGNIGDVDPTDITTSNTNQAQFVINVTEVNDQPTAENVDLGTVVEDGSIQIAPSDLIGPGLSFDPEGHNLTITSMTVPASQGTVSLNPDGVTWTFEPAPDFNGDVTITYQITDDGTTNSSPMPLSDTGEISLTVTGLNLSLIHI